MKKIYFKVLGAALMSMTMASCGNDFLDVELPSALDTETALNSTANVGYALNGTYYTFFRYYFAGNYSTTLGDLASDISYWNQKTGHQDAIYRFAYTETDYVLTDSWEYGYKVVDNATRVINACDNLMPNASEDDQATLTLYKAEAQAMRAYSNMMLANIFCHQPKVKGVDFSDRLGLVIFDEPVGVSDKVERATVGETWAHIVKDLESSIAAFESLGSDRDDLFYWGYASTCGLMARVQLYLENWSAAKTYAEKALQAAGISELTYTAEGYRALYRGGASNTESLFALAINQSNNWSANSCGTLFSTYGYSPAPKLFAMYGEQDVRLSIMGMNPAESTPVQPVYAAGKFCCWGSGNSAEGTNYIINAPEMFLIEAEADLQLGNTSAAADELLVVAKRNLAITSTSDLPADKDGLMSFLKDERARELFQEGHRLWDLRRWDEKAQLFATSAPNISYTFNDFKVSDVVFPIPADEINTKAGVVQNPDWASSRPQ